MAEIIIAIGLQQAVIICVLMTHNPPVEYNWHFDLLGVSICYLRWNDASTDWLVRFPLLMLAAFFAVVAWLCLLCFRREVRLGRQKGPPPSSPSGPHPLDPD